MVRYQPYFLAFQSRFKWRHRETDKWRRLMDATCFPVDWLTQTIGPNMSQFSGHWTHLVTCAHVVCPWDYPNYYPTEGPTRYVSRITLADTMNQVRFVSQQGHPEHKHFVSNQQVFVHNNPRLDLCVIHPEQNLKRSGEVKMMWLQNEGLVLRPRLEINDELQVGDYVWIYGTTAHETLFDEEKSPEPLMIPTGVRARVHAKTREHFFLDTASIEGQEKGAIGMGMCGSVVMRNGRCVGMLTATVHEDSNCKELAGTAMCTYASDIFEFLLEVEKQMKNPVPSTETTETMFEQRRRQEGTPLAEPKNWNIDLTRTARHVPCPISLWHMEESWMRDEDVMTQHAFGRSGYFNQETQEAALGYDMNSAKTNGDRPGDIAAVNTQAVDGRSFQAGERRDPSPDFTAYENDEKYRQRDIWDTKVMDDVRELFNQAVEDPKEVGMLHAFRSSMENQRSVKEREAMTESVFKYAGPKGPKENSEEALGMGKGEGHFEGSQGEGVRNFDFENVAHQFDSKKHRTTGVPGAGGGGANSRGSSKSAGRRRPWEEEEEPSLSKEEKYQEDLRRRHGRKGRALSGTDGLDDLWGDH